MNGLYYCLEKGWKFMIKGRQIKIYLADGSVTGIRHAEIMGWTGQALAVPRNKVKELSE